MTTSVPSARERRYAAFQEFLGSATATFEALCDRDPEAKRFGNTYSFCVTPGGRLGGKNRRQFEVFFGSRPYDSHEGLDSSLRPTMRLLAERGATLEFVRDDLGRVHIYLHPAASEGIKPMEDVIELGAVDDATKLLKYSVLSRYFQLFMAYMQCTSLDGRPTLGDRFTVARLRFFRRCNVDGRAHATRFSTTAREVIKWALTVGLSGALLTAIQWASSDGKPTTVTYLAEPAYIQQQRPRLIESEKENSIRLDAVERVLIDIRARLDAPLLTEPASQPSRPLSKKVAHDSARQQPGK